MGKGSGGSGQAKDYYGDIAGVVCAGPVDELVAIIINGATIWPTNNHWADGVVQLPVVSFRRTGGVARIVFDTPHTCRANQKFVLTGMPDASFNCAAPTTITAASDLIIKYANGGPDVGNTGAPPGTGVMTKSVHYTIGFLVAYAASIWQATALHDGTPANAPPNGAFWSEFTSKRIANPNPMPITVAGRNNVSGRTFNYGHGFFYWGTANQTLDAGSSLLANGHPPYRNQCFLELQKFYFGTALQSVPNVEVIVRKAASQTVIAGSAAALDAESQANPLATLASMFCDPIFGLGQANGLLGGSWQTIADALDGIAAQTYLSPILTKDMTMREFVAAMLAYFDGWLRFDASAVIQAGRFLHNAAPPAFTQATTIDFNDCMEEIAFDSTGLADTTNESVVKFQDKDRAFKDAAQQYVSGLNRLVVGEPRKNILERPWITREQQASDYAAEYGKINAQPSLSGKLVVRAEKAAQIAQGDLFQLTHDALAYSVVCRCVEKIFAAPPAGRATLKFSNERGIAPIPYHPSPPSPPLISIPTNELVSLFQLIQVPPLLSGNQDFNVGVLAARQSAHTRGMALWFKYSDPGALFYDLGEQRAFAVTGTLSQDYPVSYGQAFTYGQHQRVAGLSLLYFTSAVLLTNLPVVGQLIDVDDDTDISFSATGTPVISIIGPVFGAGVYHYVFQYANAGPDVAQVAATGTMTASPADDLTETLQVALADFTVQADLDKISATQSADAVDDNAMLVFLLNAANPTQFEICSLIAIRLDAGVYKLKVRRQQFGPVQRSFVAGDTVFILAKSDFQFYTHSLFDQYAQAGTVVDFRLQSFTDHGEADLSDTNVCPDVSFTFIDPFAVTVQWTQFQKLAPGDADFITINVSQLSELETGAHPFPAATQFRFSFEAAAPGSILTDAHLIASVGSHDSVLWSQSFEPSQLQLGSITFTLPRAGRYGFYVIVRDAAGRSARTILPLILTFPAKHTGIVISDPVADSPHVEPPGQGFSVLQVRLGQSLTLTGTGALYYQIKARGAAAGIVWTAYTGPIPLSTSRLVKGVSVYAYAVSGGFNSPIVRNDYWIKRQR